MSIDEDRYRCRSISPSELRKECSLVPAEDGFRECRFHDDPLRLSHSAFDFALTRALIASKSSSGLEYLADRCEDVDSSITAAWSETTSAGVKRELFEVAALCGANASRLSKERGNESHWRVSSCDVRTVTCSELQLDPCVQHCDSLRFTHDSPPSPQTA